RRRHTRSKRDWSADVCSSDLPQHISFQITDDDLMKWTMQLRLMIRDFTIRHFEHDGAPVAGFSRAMEGSERGKYHFLMKGTTPRSEERRVVKEFRKRRRRRPM